MTRLPTELEPHHHEGQTMTAPAQIVASHVAALIRGESLPPILSQDWAALQKAMSDLLQSQAYPASTWAGRQELALLVLSALNRRLAVEAHAARAVLKARTR